MTVICGTDFSWGSAEATDVAAQIAARLHEPLELVHATTSRSRDAGPGGERYRDATEQLHAAAVRPRELGADVHEDVLMGPAATTLADAARRQHAQLIVLGAGGERGPHRWFAGSVATATATNADAPLLIVRGASILSRWLRGEHRLRVVVGLDRSPNATSAARWARELRRLGPCDLVFARIVYPAEEQERLAAAGPVTFNALTPQQEALLVREMREAVGEGEPEREREREDDGARFIVQTGFGRADYNLVMLAEREGADLLVVGASRRPLFDRLRQPSVGRGALHLARTSVAFVPVAPAAPHASAP